MAVCILGFAFEMLIATLVYLFYLFTWAGWSAWMPQFLANEKHLGFQTTASYLAIWMFFAIFAYAVCGWLCDLFGRRYVIPAFVLPASILLVVVVLPACTDVSVRSAGDDAQGIGGLCRRKDLICRPV